MNILATSEIRTETTTTIFQKYSADELPQIAVQMYSPIGENIHHDRLAFVQPYYDEVGQAMQNLRAATTELERLYIAKYEGAGKVSVYYRPAYHTKCGDWQHIGIVQNDVNAMKILIGNSCAKRNAHLGYQIGWHLMAENESLAFGKFDQWDLLSHIDSPEHCKALGVKPEGNWDFARLLMHKQCPTCGIHASVNYYVYKPHTAQCAECDTRLFCPPSLMLRN